VTLGSLPQKGNYFLSVRVPLTVNGLYMSNVQVRPVVSCLVHKNIAYVRPVVSCIWQREQTVHMELHTWSTWISPIFREKYHRAVIKEYSLAWILKCPEHF